MSIRCAHCKGIHASVAEVRECSYEEQEARAEQAAEEASDLAYMIHREQMAERGGWFGYEDQDGPAW